MNDIILECMPPLRESEPEDLNVIGGKMTGSIMVGGFEKDQRSFARIMGYCQQDDVHAPFVSLSLQFEVQIRIKRESL